MSFKAGRQIWTTEERDRAVEAEDPAARFLLFAEEDDVSADDARKYGIKELGAADEEQSSRGRRQPRNAESVSEDEAKQAESTPAEDKELGQGENKGA